MGSAPALGDVDKDGVMDIVAMTGEGSIVLVNHLGAVTRTSDMPYPHTTALGAGQGTGWGGGLALADMDNDGFPEITCCPATRIWTTTTGTTITREYVGGDGTGGGAAEETSALSDMNGDGSLELLAGNTWPTRSLRKGVERGPSGRTRLLPERLPRRSPTSPTRRTARPRRCSSATRAGTRGLAPC